MRPSVVNAMFRAKETWPPETNKARASSDSEPDPVSTYFREEKVIFAGSDLIRLDDACLAGICIPLGLWFSPCGRLRTSAKIHRVIIVESM